MSECATSLLRRIERSGGKLQIDGSDILFIPREPSTADDLTNALREQKAAILALLQLRDDPLPLEWLTARCAFEDKRGEETSELLIDLATWKAERRLSSAPSRAVFESALKAEGFHVADGRVDGMHFAGKLAGCAR